MSKNNIYIKKIKAVVDLNNQIMVVKKEISTFKAFKNILQLISRIAISNETFKNRVVGIQLVLKR